MSDPQTQRETSRAAQDRTDAAGSRIASLVLGASAILIILVAGIGYALHQQARVLDGKVRAVQASINDLKARTDRANVVIGGATSGIVGLLQEQSKTGETLTRIEEAALAKAPPTSPAVIVLTPDDLAGLRSHFSLTPAGEPAQYKAGDTVPADDLKPLPAEVAGGIVPQLKGMNYLIDRNGALVVTAGEDNRVVLVVAPG